MIVTVWEYAGSVGVLVTDSCDITGASKVKPRFPLYESSATVNKEMNLPLEISLVLIHPTVLLLVHVVVMHAVVSELCAVGVNE
jgi:hypothetical protein